MRSSRIQGLYAIADTSFLSEDRLIREVALALRGGVRMVQYRDKSNDRARREHQVRELLDCCRPYNVPLILNDDVDLALRMGAAGVHVGRHDPAVAHARTVLGTSAIVGVSCYNDLSLALEAERAGATYVAFGRFFPSHTKPDAVQAHPSLLLEAKRCLRVPLVAIGGITPENAPALISAGADSVAVIHALFADPDIRTTAARFASLFRVHSCPS